MPRTRQPKLAAILMPKHDEPSPHLPPRPEAPPIPYCACQTVFGHLLAEFGPAFLRVALSPENPTAYLRRERAKRFFAR